MIAMIDRPKVLVIDDEIGPRESLRFLLKNEFEVQCAESVDQGVQAVTRYKPDLIIMDIRMPGKNGIEGLRELRQIDKDCSIVMLTGFGALETAQQALRLGANDYINKPFDTNDMRDVVRRYTRRTILERRRVDMMQQLKDMNQRLVEDIANKESMAELGRASAEFAHDLRNPLMIVTGYVQLLSRELEKVRRVEPGQGESGSSTTNDYLAVIEANVRRCEELAHTWQKIGSGDIRLFEPVELRQLLEDLRLCSEPLAFTVGVDVTFEGNPGDAKITGSRAQLVRALHNVVSNSIDSVEPGKGRVRIVCKALGCTAEITVEDNGCGMSPEVMEHMFDLYYTTKAKDKGTGLGASITRRIVEEHGGSVLVDSVVGKGTTFRIMLPVRPAAGTLPQD